MSNIDIDKLSLEITSDSSSAEQGISSLVESLGRLREATKGGLGLNSVAKGIGNLKTSLSGMSNMSSNIKGLQDAVNVLKNLGGIKVSSSIGNQIKNINGALSGLNVGDGATRINELVTALRPLETLGKSSLGTTVNALRRLPDALAGLDTRQLYTQISSLTRIMRPLAEEMQKIANGFNAFPSRIQRLIRENDRLESSNTRVGTSYINLWARMRMAYVGLRTAARVIGSAISKASEYHETINRFNVSMGQYAKEAGEYAEKVGELMGIDPTEWMGNQATFMTLATGFGVVGERASKMSQQLTQLGYDISSFHDISFDDAMLKLQSGLAGELEPLRRIGYDLSVARLQQEAYTLGINKKISAMTQAEKAELRYYAIMTQVTTAHGDMARTINSPANQLRLFKSQVTQAARAIGGVFIPVLNAVLPIAISVAKVIRLVAETISSLFGYELPEVDWDGITNMSSGADDLADSLGTASDNAKKLKQYTMGFDELNVIDPNKGNSGGETGGLGGTGFKFDLPEYDFLKGITDSKVGKIVEEMKEWLGLTEKINTWSDFFNTNLGQILILVGEIGLGIAGWKLATGLITGIAGLKRSFETLGTLGKGMKIGLGATIAITGITIEWTGLIDGIKNGLDELNFAEILGGGGLAVAGGAIIGSALGSAILGAAIGGIVAGIPAFFVGVYDACKNGIDWLSGILIPVGATATGASIGAIIGMLGGPIGAGIGALIGLAVGALTDIGILVYQKWDEIKAYFAPFWDWIYDTIVSPISSFLSGVATWFKATVIDPIIAFFSPILDTSLGIGKAIFDNACSITSGIITAIGSIFSKIGEIALKIAEIYIQLRKAFDTYIIKPIIDFVVGIATTLYTHVIEPLIKAFLEVKAYWDNSVITPIWEGLVWIREKVFEIFKKVGIAVVDFISNLFKSVINGILTLVENRVNGFIRLLNGAISIINEIPGVNITKVQLLSIPRLAEGGMVNTGQMFIAREAGPEMVGNIGRKTAVVNNEQIVASVSRGVAEANNESNALLREQNSLLRALLEKESGVYLDGKRLTNSVEKYQSQRGRVLVTGGAY